MMDDSLLKLEIDNLRELIRLKDLNFDLFEINSAILNKLSKHLTKYNDVLDIETISLLGRSNQILSDIRFNSASTNNLHQKNQPQNGQSLKTITL